MNRLPLLPTLFFILLLGGCSRPPRFCLNTEGRDPRRMTPAQEEAIRDTLEELFGTPDEPKIALTLTLSQMERGPYIGNLQKSNGGKDAQRAAGAGEPDARTATGLRIERLRAAAGAVASDAVGKQRGLYRRHCVACHGISGDGAGPSAAVLTPYPRDFRSGLFKYTSTAGGAKPTRGDLRRTLRSGLPGTAMPSFAVLPEEEIDVLVEYVQYLSIRGQTEGYVMAQVLDEDEKLPLDIAVMCEEGALPAAQSWAAAETLAIVPPAMRDPPATATTRGRAIFLRKQSRCIDCHGTAGHGDGPRVGELYDDWNQRKMASSAEGVVERSRRFRLPLQPLRPRNFHEGIFRGGDRPQDLYWRIAVGIKGTPMPAFGPAPGSPGVLSPEEIWDVVYYVRSLSGKQISR